MKVKDKKGSIAIFVLVGLLFMSSFLILLYAANVNKAKTVKEQFDIISGIYSLNDGNENSYDRAYEALRKKNTKVFSFENEDDSEKTIFENTSIIELTKTFEENLSNYRIYGNLIEGTENLFNSSTIVTGTRITSTGVETSYAPTYVTDYIPVISGKTYGLVSYFNTGTGDYSAYYDENKNLKEVVAISNGTTSITIPNGVSYIRITGLTVLKDNFQFNGITTVGIGTKSEEENYIIPIKISNEAGESVEYNINLQSPLGLEEYIDFKEGKVVRSNGKEESIDLPSLLIYEDYTKIEISTENELPKKIELEYRGYTLE